MIECKEFRDLILIPALQAVNLYSEDAAQLLLATMAQESAMGKYVEQETNTGYGPAKGVFEMEGNTYNDIVNNYLEKHVGLKQKILDSCNFTKFPDSNETIWNLKFACIMARVFYERCPGELPTATDIDGIWNYYKTFWNSRFGSATQQEFMANYSEFIK